MMLSSDGNEVWRPLRLRALTWVKKVARAATAATLIALTEW
jgi:hypothetical protein